LFNPCDQTECKNISRECVFFDSKCLSKGECQQYCSGQKTKLVCGSDGITYNNKCLAVCAGTAAASDSPCKLDVKIPEAALAPGTNPKGSIRSLPIASDDFNDKKSALENLGRKVIGRYDVSVQSNGVEIHDFSQPVSISIPYTAEQVKGFDEGGLQIYLFNEKSNQWEALPTTVDKKNKILTAPAPHFSDVVVTVPDQRCGSYCRGESSSMPAGTACLCSRDNPKGNEQGIIDRATNWIFYLGLIICPLFILLGAFMFYKSGGDSKKATGGKKIILYAVIGLTLALSAKLIYHTVRFLIGQ